ncbi:MAG: ammonium transporter [Cytophagales bacterium]|nr:ammonium transporter [Cytophagales bacterium]MDW8385165.1 ammonium transporter [Flammeovirgaceae bacterium]
MEYSLRYFLADAGVSWLSGLLANVGSTLQETTSATTPDKTALFTAHNVWMMICTGLVFMMHLGFACVEAGFTQAKNTVNILFKNTLTPIIGLLTYALMGFSLMYPGFKGGGEGFEWIGFGGLGLSAPENGMTPEYAASGGYTYWTDFLFQGMFAATCATIVSGAVAERIKITAYLLFTFFYVGFVYPIIGSWKWGLGFLDDLGFYDFAGSTLVHSVGGWGALAGVLIIGPRLGKYVDGKVIDKPGSSVPLATIGVFLLWFGWFGFNGGSVLSADPAATSLAITTTSLAASAGGIGGWIMGAIMFKRYDFGMVLNGILAGLVGITAGADQMGVFDAVIIGLISGGLVVLSAITMDKLKLDDPVGAVSVHLTCGIFGTLAVGLFGKKAGLEQFLDQLTGVLVAGVAAFSSAFLIFTILKYTIGVRVSAEHETEGLDSHEHGIRGYTIVYDE